MTKQVYKVMQEIIKEVIGKRVVYRVPAFNFSGNGGELVEVLAKSAQGFKPAKDANTSFRNGADIPEINASVKSKRFSLTDEYLGDDLPTCVDAYMSAVYATTFQYGILSDDMRTLTLYTMDAPTFKRFLLKFASFEKYSRKVRGKINSAALIRWLEANTRI